MKKFAPALALIVILFLAVAAHAGVVVDEQQTVDEINGQRVNRTRTVMIEGDKQKSIIDNGARTIITDLDKGTMTMVDGHRKTYVVIPFPPKAASPALTQGGISPTIGFKKTGAHETIIGYSCDEYSGTGTVGGNSVSMSGCFSDTAPGAADYSNFQRVMADKVKGTTMANMGQIPPGIPLRLKIITTIGDPPPGTPPEQAKTFREMLDHRKFVNDTTVAKITVKHLSPDTFQVPKGYQQTSSIFGSTRTAPPAHVPRKIPE
jgi:hypothetical protein